MTLEFAVQLEVFDQQKRIRNQLYKRRSHLKGDSFWQTSNFHSTFWGRRKESFYNILYCKLIWWRGPVKERIRMYCIQNRQLHIFLLFFCQSHVKSLYLNENNNLLEHEWISLWNDQYHKFSFLYYDLHQFYTMG